MRQSCGWFSRTLPGCVWGLGLHRKSGERLPIPYGRRLSGVPVHDYLRDADLFVFGSDLVFPAMAIPEAGKVGLSPTNGESIITYAI